MTWIGLVIMFNLLKTHQNHLTKYFSCFRFVNLWFLSRTQNPVHSFMSLTMIFSASFGHCSLMAKVVRTKINRHDRWEIYIHFLRIRQESPSRSTTKEKQRIEKNDKKTILFAIRQSKTHCFHNIIASDNPCLKQQWKRRKDKRNCHGKQQKTIGSIYFCIFYSLFRWQREQHNFSLSSIFLRASFVLCFDH